MSAVFTAQSLSTYSINTGTHVLTATLPHFSVWEITNVARLCPPPAGPPPLDCPSSYSPASQSLLLPALMIHGFQALSLHGMGNESTWANLRTLLGKLDAGNSGRIDAWRFDWDSVKLGFEESARNLRTALRYVESRQSGATPLVNLVAHSLGGILSRTYIQGEAAGEPYGRDVNRLMTLATPHTGIGGPLSLFLASVCARQASIDPNIFRTCFESGTQQELPPGGTVGEGKFLLGLNSKGLPPLQGSVSELPSYLHIRGQKQFVDPGSNCCLSLEPDDGLITLSGAEMCAGLDSPINICSTAVVDEQTISTSLGSAGLCHSGSLLDVTCSPSPYNIAMAAVNDTSHPLWQTICQFLECAPAVNVSVSNPAGGTVTSDKGGINCGSTCSAVYAGSTSANPIVVTLTANPSSGSTFSGWSGAGAGSCAGSTQLTCQITIGADYQSQSGPLFTGYAITAAFVTSTGSVFVGSWDWTDTASDGSTYSGTMTISQAAVNGSLAWTWIEGWSGTGTSSTGSTLTLDGADTAVQLTARWVGVLDPTGTRIDGTWTQSDGQVGTFAATR